MTRQNAQVDGIRDRWDNEGVKSCTIDPTTGRVIETHEIPAQRRKLKFYDYYSGKKKIAELCAAIRAEYAQLGLAPDELTAPGAHDLFNVLFTSQIIAAYEDELAAAKEKVAAQAAARQHIGTALSAAGVPPSRLAPAKAPPPDQPPRPKTATEKCIEAARNRPKQKNDFDSFPHRAPKGD